LGALSISLQRIIILGTLQKKSKLLREQITPKHPKSVGKSVVCKFTNKFFESVDNYQQIYPSINSLINKKILIVL